MKVLLLHEMSGVHTELKKGLRKLGVEADIATFGDLHKGFLTDIYLGPTSSGPGATIARLITQLRKIREFRRYDIIQSISPSPFNRAISSWMTHAVFGRKGPGYVYVSAGSDTIYRANARSLDYFPPHDWWHDQQTSRIEQPLLDRTDAIVSALWDYDYTLRRAGYDPDFIPLPVDVDDVEPIEVGSGSRIVVYHPLNRVEGNDFKGTSHIRAAFEVLRAELGHVADFVESGGMPFNEYMEFTSRVDVVVDQTSSYSYGMSALYAMARGQVVLSGNEPATHEFDAYRDSPVINITPDKEDIIFKLRRILENRVALKELGRSGRAFARKHHSAELIAGKYIDVYKRVLSARPK